MLTPLLSELTLKDRPPDLLSDFRPYPLDSPMLPESDLAVPDRRASLPDSRKGLLPGLDDLEEKDDLDSAEPERSSPERFENLRGPSDALLVRLPGLDVRFDEKDGLEEPVRSSPDLFENFLGLSLPDPARPPREEDEPFRSDRPLSLRLGIGLLGFR